MFKKYYVFLCIISITGCSHMAPVKQDQVWGSNIHHVSGRKVANKTGKNGDWRSYEVCVTIPDDGFMIKASVKALVIAGVAAGTGGDWTKDFKFVENNAYGPTKVCRVFDHQLYDQDRLLEISVDYKLTN